MGSVRFVDWKTTTMSVYQKPESLAPAKGNRVEDDDSDDWETDPDYVNDVSEKDQRWGSKELTPDRNSFSIKDLRQDVIETHETVHVAGAEKHSSQQHKYGEQ